MFFYQGNRWSVDFGNAKKLFYLFDHVIEYLATCTSVPAATDLASYVDRHRSLIMADIAASTVCWELISPIWSEFANAVTRQRFLQVLQTFRDTLKRLKEEQDDAVSILRSLKPGEKFERAAYRVLCLINADKVEQSVLEDKVRDAAIALFSKILNHQDAEVAAESQYNEDVVLHTNVPVESFFGKYDNLHNRFQNMAKTTICQTAVASFNRTDQYVHEMEVMEVKRILSCRRQSRQNERIQETFQLNERHRAKLARHEKVNKLLDYITICHINCIKTSNIKFFTFRKLSRCPRLIELQIYFMQVKMQTVSQWHSFSVNVPSKSCHRYLRKVIVYSSPVIRL